MDGLTIRGTGLARHDGGGGGGGGHAGGHGGGNGHGHGHNPGGLITGGGGDSGGGDGGGGGRRPGAWIRTLVFIAFLVVVALLIHFG
ncbi:MAG TPA: hypothetical protein VGG75_26665 [Trebonia sp.]